MATEFRAGNVSPNTRNLEFVQQCERALPPGVRVKTLRVDAAGYQGALIRHCDEHGMDYVIRASMHREFRKSLAVIGRGQWQPLLDEHGQATGCETRRLVHSIQGYDQAFTLVVQRRPKSGQTRMDVDRGVVTEYEGNGYVYCAIATNRDDLSDAEIVRWYNQRGEASENRIKELKCDFNGDTLPCSDFQANALYFNLVVLAYDLFALMRSLLPEWRQSRRRLKGLRRRLYALARKVVRSGGQWSVKLSANSCRLLGETMALMRTLGAPPDPP